MNEQKRTKRKKHSFLTFLTLPQKSFKNHTNNICMLLKTLGNTEKQKEKKNKTDFSNRQRHHLEKKREGYLGGSVG